MKDGDSVPVYDIGEKRLADVTFAMESFLKRQTEETEKVKPKRKKVNW